MKLYSYIIVVCLFFTTFFVEKNPQQKEKTKQKEKTSQTATKETQNKEKATTVAIKETKEKVEATLKVDTLKVNLKDVVTQIDTLENYNFKFYKKNAHASYYHQKFHGRRTASGKKFDNNGYTAAHKKLPFGTKVKVTNEANGKSVIVEITDRGPFSKVREIDLTKRAFMDITSNKNSGVVIVKLEVMEPKK